MEEIKEKREGEQCRGKKFQKNRREPAWIGRKMDRERMKAEEFERMKEEVIESMKEEDFCKRMEEEFERMEENFCKRKEENFCKRKEEKFERMEEPGVFGSPFTKESRNEKENWEIMKN